MRPFAILFWLALAGCGYVGDPLPPALNIPNPVSEVGAAQIGPDIVVLFSLPTLTTDNLPVGSLRGVELMANDALFRVPADATEFPIAAAPFAGKDVALRLRAIGRTGRPSAWSDSLTIPVATPLARPTAVTPANVPEGVALTWNADAPMYRVLRAIAGGELTPLAESRTAAYIDNTTVYGTPYRYQVIGINGPSQQSLPSDIVPMTPTDTFAPAVPTGLAAVPGASTIELSWTRNTDDDFASYRIRRSTGGAFDVLANTPTPAYSDNTVQSGRRYRYTVSAIDERGNESPHSEPAEAALP